MISVFIIVYLKTVIDIDESVKCHLPKKNDNFGSHYLVNHSKYDVKIILQAAFCPYFIFNCHLKKIVANFDPFLGGVLKKNKNSQNQNIIKKVESIDTNWNFFF